ncbi:uncharacterized protein LOC114749696 [Neltuma alba]|uniref:uncharacterized protein LOC114749696 n=1 Tax=Neltuma alba TaxID=207710 RepID=UPI0010A2C1DA|nr:uncharacterized protein LOC114749696 [Prosopis alba]
MARSLATTKEEREDLEQQITRMILRGVENLDVIRRELKRQIRAKREFEEKEKRRAAEAADGAEEEEGITVEVENAEENRLYKAICKNRWERAKALLENKPSALTSKITASGKTPFHVAALFGHVKILEELLELLDNPESLETVDDVGNTPLLIATVTGSIEVAKYLVDKNPKLLGIPNSTNELPATLALLIGHREMGNYLYSQTPLEYLQPNDDRPLGPTLLRCCLETQCFDIAHHLLSKCQDLLFASDNEDWKPIFGIATMNSTMPSPSELVFWKRWIYDYLHFCLCFNSREQHYMSFLYLFADVLDIDANSTPSFQSASLPVHHKDTREKAQGKLIGPAVAAGPRLLRRLIFSAYNFVGIKKLKELKLLHAQANEIVRLVCKNASKRDEVITVADALFRAAKEGNVEFVVQISKANPEILLIGDNSYRNIFYHAIEHRQARFFSLIHGLRFKDVFASSRDRNGNSLLHAAATQAPASLLDRIRGPTLQMQRELQWFKEVEKLIPTTIRKARNSDGMTAEELFKQKHEGLMIQEKIG